ncbi:MAG: hypothetical protein JWN59_1464 [Sphingomonas bacterium]|nr:hypothetical protein [Sphingomonas bacterium]
MAIIHARPYDDPRNTVVVDNNDPNALDKTHAGRAGTHHEQRCCDNKAPSRLPQQTGWYVDADGHRIVQIVAYWSRPENRAGARDGWWNAETPPGFFVEMALTGTLMCDGCFGDEWDQFTEDLSSTFDTMVPVIRIIAMAISYIPVLGTAVSFVINASVSLAQGANVDEAFLDGVGAALPGQPVSGSAYNAVRAVIRGDRIDQVVINALPLDDGIKSVLAPALDIAVGVAHGRDFTDIAIDQLFEVLPDEGKNAIDIARHIISGEDAGGLIVDDSMRAAADAARSQGQGAINKYIAQAGFQGALQAIDPELGAAVIAGLVAGNSERHQFIGTFDFSEKNVHTNDDLARKGQSIAAAGARWRFRLLSKIRAAPTFTFTRTAFDALSGTMQPRTDVYEINDQWRRGFDVAVGLCEGMSADGPGQQAVKLSLGNPHAKNGFDVGQYIQHSRTSGGITDLARTNASLFASAVESASSRGRARLTDGSQGSRPVFLQPLNMDSSQRESEKGELEARIFSRMTFK